MVNKVVITAFSGENRISSREVSVDDYYDEEHPEFDSYDYIREHCIDRVEIVMDSYGEHKEYTNYYDKQGRLFRSEENENGEQSAEEITYDTAGRTQTTKYIPKNSTRFSEKDIAALRLSGTNVILIDEQ